MASKLHPPLGEAATGPSEIGKVAVVCHGHPSLSNGGAEIAAYALFRGLRENGIDAIYVGACSISDRHRLALGDEHEFAVYFDSDRYDHFYHLAPGTVSDQLASIVRDEEVDIVSFHHFLNIGLNAVRAVGVLPGVRCFLTLHEFLAICHNHGQMITRPKQILCTEATPQACVSCFPDNLRSEFVMRKQTMLEILGQMDGFISPSRFLADRFVHWGLDEDRMTVIENGLLRLAASTAKVDTPSSWTFGFFGQINPFKGVDVILDAVELLAADPELSKSVRFRIHGNVVGQSQKFASRFEKVLKKHSCVSYAGPYNNAMVHRLMSDCDYVVVPSKWWENSPLVIQEAFAAGVPVVCSGIGGMAEKVVDGASGLHFRPGDAADLIRAVKVAANAEQARTLRAGIPGVHSAHDMASAYAEFFGQRAQPTSRDPGLDPLAENALRSY